MSELWVGAVKNPSPSAPQTCLISAKAYFRLLLDVVGLPVLIEDKPHPLDENIRRVERGSRIVVAVTEDTKVILQVREQEYF